MQSVPPKRRLWGGVLFAAIYAAGVLALGTELGTGGRGLVRCLTVFALGVGVAGYLFSWVAASALFALSLALAGWLYFPVAAVGQARSYELVHLGIYLALAPAIIRATHVARKRLGRAEERYRLVVESASDGILIIDAEGNYLWANSKACQMFGYTRTELVGVRIENLIELGAASDESEAPARVSLDAGRLRECRAYRKDGGELTVEVSGKLLSDGRFMAIVRDVTERRKAEDQIRASLREKEVLLKEIHHRVKNNLQFISSLLSLQRSNIQDPQALAEFTDSLERIKSIALLHEKLYQSRNAARIDFAEYVRTLTRELLSTYRMDPARVALTIEMHDALLELETAMPCGLIVNELVTNAFKHAFPGGQAGQITISMKPNPDQTLTLAVRDTGVGLPEGAKLEDAPTLGLRLVSTLARQLNGRLEIRNSAGAEFRITFPDHSRRREQEHACCPALGG